MAGITGTSKFDLGGIKLLDVVAKIENTGVTKNEAALVLAGWLLENAGRSQRTFNFRSPLPGDCETEFTRTFRHDNWRDGEDVVQAEDYGDTIGMNTRFNNLGADIDTLAERLKGVVECVNELRSSVASLFEEVRLEMNRLNADIFNLSGDKGGGGIAPGTVLNPGKFLGNAKLLGQDVQLYQTAQGVLTLPLMNVTASGGGYESRIDRVGSLAKYIEEEPEVRASFGEAPLTRVAFVEKFGTRTTPDGLNVAELVEILPADTEFANVGALLDAVGDREAGLIRASGGTDAALAATFGLGSEVTDVSAAPVGRVGTIDAATRVALASGGVDTVEKLAGASAAEIVEKTAASGRAISLGDAAALSARAKAIVRLQR